jgi:hypothetical protein
LQLTVPVVRAWMRNRPSLYAAQMSGGQIALRIAVVAACAAPSAAAGASLSGAAAVATLNAQRAANGIPAGLVERPAWSKACATRLRAVERTGGPGYATQGMWAVTNAALARDVWTAKHDPWASMPVQQMALLSPLLLQLGAGASRNYVCVTTRPGYLRPAPAVPSLYPYPGDGSTGVSYTQFSYGLPLTPGDAVGLPAGFNTGPNLLVMADLNAQAKMVNASLTGPTGPVEIRTVDNTVAQIGDFLAPGGIIIPVDPLKPGRAYTARAVMSVGGALAARQWSFTTAKADPQTLLFVSSAAVLDPATPGGIRQGSVAVRTSSPAPVRVTVAAIGQTIGEHDFASGDTWVPPQTPGSYVACAHQDATDDYAAYDRCLPLHIRELASFVHPTQITIKAAIVGRTLRYKLAVKPALRRRVTLQARRLVNGSWHTFRTVVRDARIVVTRTVTARTTDQAVQMVVSVPKGRLGAETYQAAAVTKTVHRG